MSTQEFHAIVKEISDSFNPSNKLPFRVACSTDHNGADRVYGSHVEQREYADYTVAYCYTLEDVMRSVIIGLHFVETNNMLFQHERGIEDLDNMINEIIEDLELY